MKKMNTKIWITVPTHNRKTIARICLKQLSLHKKDNFLHVSDDHSSEFDPLKEFEPWADKIERTPKKMGVQHLRCWEFREFLKQDEYDLIYMTDSDTLHDPGFINRLLQLYLKYKSPVCLYNAKAHQRPIVREDDRSDISIRKTMPGVSQLYDRRMVEKIVKILDVKGDPVYAWDYRVVEYLARNTITSRTSFLQHFGGEGSIHNKTLQQDVALNPTNYLKMMWNPVVSRLKTNDQDLTFLD